MKNTGLYVLGGITLAAVAALAVIEYRKRDQLAAAASNQAQIDAAGTALSLQKFKGFNFSLLLNASTKQALAENTALQRMINAYYNGSDAIAVTAIFDTETSNAVKDITGKTSTSLSEFNFQYLIKKRGEKVANDLLTSMTLTGKEAA